MFNKGLIDFLKKYTDIKNDGEIGEQDAPAAEPAAGGSASTGKTPKKWESGRTMGKTYGGPGYKWESGRTFLRTTIWILRRKLAEKSAFFVYFYR